MSDPKPGEQYSRTQTFTVQEVDTNGNKLTMVDGDGLLYHVKLAFLDELQKLEPPAVYYQAGQTVVRKSDGAFFTLTADGYFAHATGELVKSEGAFTSESYELAVIS